MSTATRPPPMVDTRLMKFSQAGVVVLSAVAFLFQSPLLVVISAAILGVSAIAPAASPFRLVYRGVLVPAKVLQPRRVEDDPAPHRFAQGVGTAFLIASTLVLYLTKLTPLGWGLDLLVFALSFLNFSVGFCAGCFVYYQLGRLGVLPRVSYAGNFHWRGV